jgi:hypothetical protein
MPTAVPNVETMYIAGTLKDTLRTLYDFDELQLHGKLKDVCDPRYGYYTPRDLCSLWNEKLMEIHGKDFLVKRMFRPYDASKIKPNLIITDVRYPHDCEEIRRRQGIIVKVERRHLPIKLSHEEHIDGMYGDITVYNTGDLFSLYRQVKYKVLPRLIES